VIYVHNSACKWLHSNIRDHHHPPIHKHHHLQPHPSQWTPLHPLGVPLQYYHLFPLPYAVQANSTPLLPKCIWQRTGPETDEKHIFYFTDMLLLWGNCTQVVLLLSPITFPCLRKELTPCLIKLYYWTLKVEHPKPPIAMTTGCLCHSCCLDNIS